MSILPAPGASMTVCSCTNQCPACGTCCQFACSCRQGGPTITVDKVGPVYATPGWPMVDTRGPHQRTLDAAERVRVIVEVEANWRAVYGHERSG